MIFWIFVMLTIIGIIFTIKVKNIEKEKHRIPSFGTHKFHDFLYRNCDSFIITGSVVAIIAGGVLLGMLCCIAESQILADTKQAKNEQRYKLLIYEAQSESIRNEFGVSNKEYINEVQKWNEELAEYRAHSNNFWIDVFYPKRKYEGLGLIDLESIGINLDEEYDVPESEEQTKPGIFSQIFKSKEN